jgi:hypothetical protein
MIDSGFRVLISRDQVCLQAWARSAILKAFLCSSRRRCDVHPMHFDDLSMGRLRDAGEHLSSCRANNQSGISAGASGVHARKMTLESLGIVFYLSRLFLPTTSQRSPYIFGSAELRTPGLFRTKKAIVLEGLVPMWMLWYVASSSDPASVLRMHGSLKLNYR